MKKMYETPVAEKVTFQYEEQIVASQGGGTICEVVYQKTGLDNTLCPEDDQVKVEYLK